MSQHTESSAALAAKATPAVAYLGATVGGLSIPDWAALAALIYSLLLIAQQLYRFYLWLRAKQAERDKARAKRRRATDG